MQDYGQPGGGAPPPPMAPPPKKKKGGKILMIIGIILLIVGLLMMVMLWPMVGTIDDKELAKKIAKTEKGTYTVMFDISNDEWKGMELAEELGAGDIPDGIDGAGTYVVTVEIKGELDVKYGDYQKVPTIGGFLGIFLLIVGIILMIVGIIKGKKAKAQAALPPPPPPPPPAPGMQPPPQY